MVPVKAKEPSGGVPGREKPLGAEERCSHWLAILLAKPCVQIGEGVTLLLSRLLTAICQLCALPIYFQASRFESSLTKGELSTGESPAPPCMLPHAYARWAWNYWPVN